MLQGNNALKIRENAIKENPVVLQTEISCYMHWSLPLCFVLAYENFRAWFDENFIQIYAQYIDNPGYDSHYLWVDFYNFTPNMFHNPMLFGHYTQLGYEESRRLNIIDYICEKINAGYYIIIYLDENIIPGKRAYQKMHFVHPSLIYGYDTDESKFLTVGLNTDNILDKIEIGFDNFADAFALGEQHYQTDAAYAGYYIIQLFLPTDFTYELNVKEISNQLRKYLNGQGELNKIIRRGEIRYNLPVHDEIIRNLELRLHNRHTIDYRSIHVLFEQKRGVLTRLQNIQSLLGGSQTLHRLIEEFKPLVNDMDQARLAYLKCAFAANNFQSFYKLPPDKAVIDRINTTLVDIKAKEPLLLASICDELDTLAR